MKLTPSFRDNLPLTYPTPQKREIDFTKAHQQVTIVTELLWQKWSGFRPDRKKQNHTLQDLFLIPVFPGSR